MNEYNDMSNINCCICGSKVSLWNKLSSGVNVYFLMLCKSCRFAFAYPRPEASSLYDLYSKSSQGVSCLIKYDDVIDEEKRNPNSVIDAERMISKIIDMLSKNNISSRKFLEVGSGYGFFSKKAMEKGFDVTAIELAETERAITKKMTGLDPVAVSFEDFSGSSKLFSSILMSQVLEHALDVDKWIGKASSLLVPGGVLAIALPNFDSIVRIFLGTRDPYICPPIHLNYFTKESLSRLLAKHGFGNIYCNFVYRISKDAINRRLSPLIGPFIPIKSVLRLAYNFGVGMFINMYAVKI